MKDIMGAALLGELMAALARSAALRASLGSVPAEEADALVRRLVNALERLAAEGVTPPAPPVKKPSLFPAQAPDPRPTETPRAPAVTSDASARSAVSIPEPKPDVAEIPSATVVSPPPAIKAPVPSKAASKPFPAPPSPPPTKDAVPPSKVASIVVPPPMVAHVTPPPTAAHVTPPPMAPHVTLPPAPPVRAEVREPDPPASPLRVASARVPFTFENETAFVLAASLIPLQDTSSPEPFGIGTEGVERGSDVFAFDHSGIRFFLSTLENQEASVSRTGVLLLGKQESIRHRNVHERLVNALRLQALILPAEAGTVVFGRHDLVRRVDFRINALFELLLSLSTLTTWRVNAFVLDAHVHKMLPAEQTTARAGRHEAERGRVPSTAKKTDIKTLERLLNREKKLAESILQRLLGTADRHTVESIVNLGSGSSEDWKPILKATFEVPPVRFPDFARAVVECQEANAMFDPMLSVVGGPGSFSLSM